MVVDREAIVEFRDVTLGYGRRRVFSNLSFTVYRGEFLGIVGPNGSGKTTILKAILGTISPRRGKLVFHSANSKEKIRIGYVPQREALNELFPLGVKDIVIMGMYAGMGVFRRPKASDFERVFESLSYLGIEHLATAPYRELSGGQKQRVLVARALVSRPQILLLDEPTNGMDIASQTQILDIIRDLYKNVGITVVLVSHLLNEVINYVGRVALVGDGFFQVGSKEEIFSEKNLKEIYDMELCVREVLGRKIIILGGESGKVN